MCKRMHTLSHLNVNTHTDVQGTPWRHCLLTCYLGSKRQQLKGEKFGRAIICWGKKLQPSVVFVLRQTWQKKRFPPFHKNEGIFLFLSHHHVRDSLKYSEYFFFFFKSKLGGNESQLHLWSKPGDIKGIHMTTVHFHTITATVMAVIGWIGPLISLMHPLSPTKLVSASSEIHPFLF